MARETKEERVAREAREESERLAATAVYRASIPARLMMAQVLAQEVGISTTIRLTATGPSVRFYDSHDEVFDETVCYTTEEWELEYLERRLREKKEEQDARVRRRGIAEDVWANKLTAEEKAALKENIHFLR